ncbi:MAG: DUF4157 domain-containing protein [Kofleriaceae bacterium]|nr:DUF4157 domain-containing protein [Kofleriaceae bacterium]
MAGPAGALPFADVIQRSFGAHDLSAIQAHVGGPAAAASAAMGAEAYATGQHVAFARAPDLHTAAHEAARVVQQRAGVQLKGGVGEVGDAYEQQADAVADAVVRGESAEHLLGAADANESASAVGHGVQHRKPPRGPHGPAAGDEPVTRRELEESEDKGARIRSIMNLVAMLFDNMKEGVDAATDPSRLTFRTPKKTAFLLELVNIAAMASIAGTAGVVAQVIARKYFVNLTERFVTDAIKDTYKKSIRIGKLATEESHYDELARFFQRTQKTKIDQAKGQFFAEFPRAIEPHLRAHSLDELDRMMAEARARTGDPEVSSAAERHTAMEWVNLVARTRYGAGAWDPWAGEHGSEGAIPTSQAKRPPHVHEPGLDAGRYMSQDDPDAGNIDHRSPAIRDSIDRDQHTMNPSLSGVLVINVFAGRPPRLYQRSGFGLRLYGVSDYVKRRLAEFPNIGALRVNKVVVVYGDEHLSPPKPLHRFLITADGYIRATTGFVKPGYLQEVSDTVQAWAPRGIQ